MQQLSDDINISEVLAGLVEEGQLGLAQRWAATLPQNFQIDLVAHCVASDRLKEAVKLVRHLNLQQVCPTNLLQFCKTDCLLLKFCFVSGRAYLRRGVAATVAGAPLGSRGCMFAMSCQTGPVQMSVMSSGTSAMGRLETVNTL